MSGVMPDSIVRDWLRISQHLKLRKTGVIFTEGLYLFLARLSLQGRTAIVKGCPYPHVQSLDCKH